MRMKSRLRDRGQISIVTRSDSNQLHGTLFDYLRNDLFDANDWFVISKKVSKPEERQNDFGGTLGGPVLKDKTFFFFFYEGLRLRLSTLFTARASARPVALSQQSARTQADRYRLAPGAQSVSLRLRSHPWLAISNSVVRGV
jgi:hypothetical protein